MYNRLYCFFMVVKAAASRRQLLGQVVLFQFDAYMGRSFEVERKQRDECINIRYYNDSDANFDNRASSVFLGENCVVLHEHIGCSGRSLKLDWNNTANSNCNYHLKECTFDDMTSSVSFCDANFPDNYESSNLTGYKGSQCIDSCKPRQKPYFWCNTQNGSWDFCSPRPGVDFLGNSCQDSCVYNDTTFPQSVVLYEAQHQKGREYRMNDQAETPCWNFGYTSESQSTPKVDISSIYLDSSCVQMYDNIGCSGNYFELTSELEDNCWSKIKSCSEYNKIVSAKLCSVDLPPPYDPAFGISGSRCYSRCHTRSRHYFWCHLEDNSWDFCSPRPGIDYFGDRCEANCSSPEKAHENGITVYELGPSKSENQEVELFVGLRFQSKRTTISYSEEVKCFNLGYDENLSVNFNHMVYSIRLSSANLFSCVILHDSVGCTGNFLVVSSYDNVECHENLENCNWSTSVSSVSFCDTRFPRKFPEPKGITGQVCIDDCATRGKPYFWCHLANGSQEFCIPRPGQSFLGNFCSGNCTQDYVPEVTPGFSRWASLYMKEWFQDKHITIDTGTMSRCLNLGYDAEQDANFNNAIYSVAIDHEVCLRLHDKLGCVGKYLEVSHETNIKCHRDLESCGWHRKVSSVSRCGSKFTSKTSLSTAVLADKNCSSPGEAGQANLFCCEVDTSWNFCFPRTAQNYLGDKWPAKYMSKFEHLKNPVLYNRKAFSGISEATYDLENRKCINLRNDTGYAVSGREPLGKPFFWCHLQNGTSDYCLPRPGQDSFGNDCEENCFSKTLLRASKTDNSSSHQNSMNAHIMVLSLLLSIFLNIKLCSMLDYVNAACKCGNKFTFKSRSKENVTEEKFIRVQTKLFTGVKIALVLLFK
ncbi:unnamed protein product [Allacma fusca]|uniref:Uncharacterized protein n=1 Tax=Allacma fusca TaxID=39272 RepID=A0A8J2LWX2_9HEXA|nr:unnamed protein product [Allacma fusca]